jgi:hypothetical protein
MSSIAVCLWALVVLVVAICVKYRVVTVTYVKVKPGEPKGITVQFVSRDIEEPIDSEPSGPDDYSDDAYVLASAGMGTDEDYGYYGGSDE